jgi:Tfp pilus assembly protein PilO
MNTWIPKNRIVKSVAAMVFISIIIYFIGLFIVFNQIKKVENLYNDTESEFSKNEKFLAVRSIAEANQETITYLKNFLIQKGDEVKFIEKIEEVAKNSGIKFEIVYIDTKTSKEEVSFKEDVGVKMNIEGSWKNIMSFVNKLERLIFGVSINSMNLDVSSGQWSGSVEFIIFREK